MELPAILYLFSIHSIQSSLAPSNLMATRIGPCSNTVSNKTVVAMSEMSIFTNIYDSTASGQFNITRDIANGWYVQATMQKCKDLRNLETCDYFRSYPLIKGGCDSKADSGDTMLYMLFFHYTQPRLSCPIKAGSYEILSYPFMLEDNYMAVSESKISNSVFGYTYKLEGFYDNELLLCVETHLQLIYIRENNELIEAVGLSFTEEKIPPLSFTESES